VIKLTVQSYNSAPLPQSLVAQFDELGGTIGRADNNQLVLPDPERSISRVHAQVVFRNGSYAIIDRGSNPVLINGRPLGNGVEGPIKHGDQLQIGGYIISVESANRATVGAGSGATSDPFGDPFADLGGVAFSAPPARPPSPAAPAAFPAFGADPFASLSKPHASASSTSAAGGIPDDWDPFAPEPVAKPSNDLSRSLGGSHLGLEIGGAAPAPLIPGMGDMGGGKANTSSSIDAMFGLGAGDGSDPFANSILAPAAMAPNMANHVDPMRSLNSVNAGSATAAPDNVSALNQPFLEAALQKPQSAALPVDPAPAKGAVLSWDEAGTAERTVIRSSSKPRAPVAATPSSPSLIPASASTVAAVVSAPVASGGPVDHAALIQALREGLEMPGLQVPTLTPEFMRLLGQLLHEAAGGTVDLLVARQTLKREVQAEMTMISTKGNNPLKFSPSAEVALNYLLNPPSRGFMPGAPAMRDAYNDLRAHQVAFIAGVKSALEGVLKRFDPAVLEGKLTQKSVLSSLLPASRKAKMWDVFTELYGQISAEASEDFHELFGEEFRRAYDEHIQQLKRNG
jgi:FHA domain-containing protein